MNGCWVTSRVITSSELGCGIKECTNKRKTRLTLCALLSNHKRGWSACWRSRMFVQAWKIQRTHLTATKHLKCYFCPVVLSAADWCLCLFLTRTVLPSGETSGRGGCWRPPDAPSEDQALCVQQSDGLGVSLLLPPGHNLGQHTQVNRDTCSEVRTKTNRRQKKKTRRCSLCVIKLDGASKLKVCPMFRIIFLSAVRWRFTVSATAWPPAGGGLPLAALVQARATRPATGSACTGESGSERRQI